MKKAILLVAAILAVTLSSGILYHHHRAQQAVTKAGAVPQTAPRTPSNIQRLSEHFGHLPLSFEENRGQSDPRVKFVSRGRDYGLFLSPSEATIVHHAKAHVGAGDLSSAIQSLASPDLKTSSVVHLSWLGANSNAQARGVDRQRGVSNYLIGKDPSKWRRNVAHYGGVQLRNIYPGIDLVYHGKDQKLEFDYVIAPGANPAAIQVGINGPSLVHVDNAGRLSISSGGDEITLLPPVAYQEKTNGDRSFVEAKYVLADSHKFGFQLGDYDPSRPLIIDPVLDFAANFGNDIASDVVLDTQGNMYITGTTCETNFPTTVGAFQTTGGNNLSSACNKAIVTKLDPAASTLIYSTYIGGSGVEFAVRLLVDGAGEATIVGSTTSTDFPTTTGVFQSTAKGGTCTYGPFLQNQACSDAFLLKLNAGGSGLVYSTLFGGERAEIAIALTQDSTGNSYIAGATNSTLLPVNASSFQKTYGGQGNCQQGAAPCFDGFIAKFNPDGTQLLASTYLGGIDDDFITALAVDKTTGNLYATGSADSTNFPTTAGSVQPTHAGTTDQRDVFLSRLDPTLHTLQYSTFLGGSQDDIATNVKVDSAGVVYLTGSTISSDFPVTDHSTYKGPPPAQTSCGSTLDGGVIDTLPNCGDIFVAKIDSSKPSGSQLVFATLIGGSGSDEGFNLALDSKKNIWVAGGTNSQDFPFTSDAYYTNAGPILLELKNDGSQVLFSSALSPVAANGRLALGINIDASDNVLVAGEGGVSPTPGAYADPQGTIFLVKFSQGTARPAVTLSATSIDFSKDPVSGVTTNGTPFNAAIGPRSVTLTNSGTAPLHFSISLAPPQQGAQFFTESDNCGMTLAAAAMCTISAVYEPDNTSTGIDGATIFIFSDAPGSPTQLSLSGRSGLVESASFVPPTLSFPNQAPGTTSASQTSSFANPATTQTSIFARPTGAPVLSGANASDFHLDLTNCPANATFCSLGVTFAPVGNTPANRTATVTLPSNAPNSPSVLSLTGTVATGPAAVISPNPFNLSPTIVGQGQNTSFIVTNTGGGTLNVTNIVVSGTNASEFVVSPSSCPLAFNLPSQQVCGLSLAFTPLAHGNRTATITLTDNETTPASVGVTGYAADNGGPELSLGQPNNAVNGVATFGDTVVGRTTIFEQSLITLFNFANPGANSGAHITGIALTGDFVQTNTCPVPPAQLTGGLNCGFVVEFAPTAVGQRTGTLTITTDAPGTPTFTANFTGKGVTIPTAVVSPTALDFGKQESGSTTPTALTATLKNTGSGALNISNVAISGPFTQTNTCGSSLTGGAMCTFSVKFAPTGIGPASGNLSIASNTAGGATSVGLNGVGVSGASAMLQPSSLLFGNQPIGTMSAAKQVLLTNVGDTAFNFNGITVGENFKASPGNCAASLAPGATCTLTIAFAPTNDTFQGATTGGAAFVSVSTPGSPLKVTLGGVATASTGAPTTDTITSAPNPSTFGQPVTITATVTSQTPGTITGAVTFFDGSTQLGTPVAVGAQGKATLVTSTLAVGTHGLSFQYSGDANFAPSNSSGVGQTVNAAAAAATTTVVTSTLNPSTVGASVTFNVQVSSQTAGPLTGTASLMDGATLLGGASVGADGKAAFTTSTLTAGMHSITAIYNGNTNFLTSTSPAITQTVNGAALAATSTAVGSSLNPSTFGASVTFTATVTSQTAGTITGSVTFKDGATSLGMGTIASGKATLATAALAGGTHSITAVYSGDANFAASTSAALTQTVNKAASSTVVTSSLNPSTVGTSVTFTATVTSQTAGTITGSVTFMDGATSLGIGTVGAGGTATLATSALTQGTHTVTAVYGGDANFVASTSSTLTETVNAAVTKTATTTTLASSANPSNVGASVTFTATVSGQVAAVTGAKKVTAQSLPAVSGTVTFVDGTTTLGTGAAGAGGVATFATSALTAGTHSITAQYGGDNNFAASTSAALAQTVNAPDFSVSANPTSLTLTAGQSGMVALTVTPLNGSTQTVGFTCGSPQAGPQANHITCTFMPAQVPLDGTHTGTSMATIITVGNNPSAAPPLPRTLLPPAPLGIFAALLAMLFAGWAATGRQISRRMAYASGLLLFVVFALGACNGGSRNNGTPPGTYAITITAAATSGGTSHPATVSVIVH